MLSSSTFSPDTQREQERLEQNFKNRLTIYLRILRTAVGFLCFLSSIGFVIGVVLMALDFDGSDDEYYIEDGDIKTRMGQFDYGVISLGIAVILTIFAAILWAVICFLPALTYPAVGSAVLDSNVSGTGTRPGQQRFNVPPNSPPPYHP